MNKPKGRNKKIQPEQKLSFGSALKQNVIIFSINLKYSSKIPMLLKNQENLRKKKALQKKRITFRLYRFPK
jgi:hypothetical protein